MVLLGGAVVARYVADVGFARMLGAEDFGRYAVVLATATLLAMASSLGFPNAAMRFVSVAWSAGDYRAIRSFTRYALSRSWALAILVAAVAAAIGARVTSASALESLLLVTTTSGLVLTALYRQVLVAIRSLVASLLANIAVPLCSLAALGAAALTIDELDAPVALGALTIALAVTHIVQRSVVRSRLTSAALDDDKRCPVVRRERSGWLRSGLVTHLNAIATYVTSNVDLLIVSAVSGAETGGVYAAASRTALLVTLALNAVGSADGPQLASDYQAGQLGAVRRRLIESAKFSALVAVFSGAFLIGFGSEVLSAFGSEFEHGHAWLALLVLGRIANASTGSVSEFLIGSGNEWAAAWSSLTVAVIFVPLMLVGALSLGPAGAAGAAAMASAVRNGWHLMITRSLTSRTEGPYRPPDHAAGERT